MTQEAVQAVFDTLKARFEDRNSWGADLPLSPGELSSILELAEDATAGPWLIETSTKNEFSGNHWLIAEFGHYDRDGWLTEEGQAHPIEEGFVWLTTDHVRASELGVHDGKFDATYVAFMHPGRVIRMVKEIERLRLALAKAEVTA